MQNTVTGSVEVREQVEQILDGAGRVAAGIGDRAVEFFRPAGLDQVLLGAGLLDVGDLVERPERPAIGRDALGAERDRFAQMRMVEAAARLAEHAGDLALLGFDIGEQRLEVAVLDRLVVLALDQRAHTVEQIALREAEPPVLTDLRDDLRQVPAAPDP